MFRLADLRQILRYVPQYRDKTFVIALDGGVVADANFANILLDVALLRSLRIQVALVHGAGFQIGQLAVETGTTPSNLDGTGITDDVTLRLAQQAAYRVTHEILAGFAANDLRGACSNAVVAHPAGILQGVNFEHTGRIERVDTKLVLPLLQNDIVPVIPPLGCDGEGQSYRLNSDAVAVEVARAVKATKLIYLTSATGIVLRTDQEGDVLLRQLKVAEAEQILSTRMKDVSTASVSKLRHAVRATRGGVPRVHVIDGRVEEGLLAEVFSNEGIGTLVHTDEYQAIRPATKKDTPAIFHLIGESIENDELRPRTLDEIDQSVEDYYVFEVDGHVAGCAALHVYPHESKAELACVCVDTKFENQGIGNKLMHFGEAKAKQSGIGELFCLSTQAFNYFVQKGGFHQGSPDLLPPERRHNYDASGRKSQVLVKRLKKK